MNDDERVEYEQLSADWRHRDSLTWQIPTVLVAVGGVLVAEAFKLPSAVEWLKPFLLLGGFLLSASLTVALWQNLRLQKGNQETIKRLNPNTNRVGFPRIGSGMLLILSCLMTVFLGTVTLLVWTGNV